MHNHRHNYQKKGEHLICEGCGKTILSLENSSNKDLLIGKRKNGKFFSVRKDRHRYFFPEEWERFISKVKEGKHKILFETLLHTGARIMEALHLKVEDFDFERNTIIFKIVKQRKAKKRYISSSKTRSFFVSPKYLRKVKKYIREEDLSSEDFLFMDSSRLPDNYEDLSNEEKRKYYNSPFQSYSAMLKRKLKTAGIEDYWNFSLHNIRKTYGNWMRVFNIEIMELCYRMGHDMDTFMEHYGSSLRFTDNERRKISKIMGEVK